MTEGGDLAKVSKAESCQHCRIYELKRTEHFKVQLGTADDKLIYPLQKKTPSAKESSLLVANLKKKCNN